MKIKEIVLHCSESGQRRYLIINKYNNEYVLNIYSYWEPIDRIEGDETEIISKLKEYLEIYKLEGFHLSKEE